MTGCQLQRPTDRKWRGCRLVPAFRTTPAWLQPCVEYSRIPHYQSQYFDWFDEFASHIVDTNIEASRS